MKSMPFFNMKFLQTRHLMIAMLLCSGCTPSIHDCIAQDKLTQAESLLVQDNTRANSLTEKGKTPVHAAVYYKDIDALNLLLKHGADLDQADLTGMTPLHDAAQLWRKDEAAWLIEHGADLSAKDIYGDTPAHVAAMVNGGPMLKLLHDHGANLDAPNNDAKTPAELAREHGHERAAAYIEKLLGQ